MRTPEKWRRTGVLWQRWNVCQRSGQWGWCSVARQSVSLGLSLAVHFGLQTAITPLGTIRPQLLLGTLQRPLAQNGSGGRTSAIVEPPCLMMPASMGTRHALNPYYRHHQKRQIKMRWSAAGGARQNASASSVRECFSRLLGGPTASIVRLGLIGEALFWLQGVLHLGRKSRGINGAEYVSGQKDPAPLAKRRFVCPQRPWELR